MQIRVGAGMVSGGLAPKCFHYIGGYIIDRGSDSHQMPSVRGKPKARVSEPQMLQL